MAVTLERLKESGAYAYESIFLTQLKSYSFGQMSSNDFILYAPTVENNHCIFHNQPNGLFVEVLKNSSGVLRINGEEYLSSSIVRLNNNDIVNIGLLLKYKVKMKLSIPIADNSNYVKKENDVEDGLPYHNVNDLNVENLGNEGATLCTERFQSDILQKVKESSSKKIGSGLSLQEINAAMQIEIGKEENDFENLLSEKEYLSDSSPEEVPLPDSSMDDKILFNSSSTDKNLLSTKPSIVSLTDKVLGLKVKNVPSVFLEEKTNQQRLQTHSVYHNSERPFVCDLCGRSYKSKPSIRLHIIRVHSAEKQTCKICKQIFGCNKYLNDHMFIHLTEKNYKCSICEKDFRRKNFLQRHMLRHSTEKKFKCSFCEKVFRCKEYLRIHTLTHSTEKKFKCSVCEKGFVRKQHMQQHMLRHSTEKQFKCFICEKSIRCKQYLKIHMLLHSKERKFKCSLCAKGFIRKCYLKDHMLTHSTKKSSSVPSARRVINTNIT